MTYNEVLALTDSDLRIEVAKLTGATDFAYNPYDENRMQAYWPENDKGNGEGWREIPDYPNDIAEAWELLKKARSVPALMSRFCEAVDDTISADAWGLLESLDARTITIAFVLAMRAE